MSELQGIARFKFDEGKLEEFKRLSAQCMEIVRTKDTGTLQYEIYVNDDQSECIVLERYKDSEALIPAVPVRSAVASAAVGVAASAAVGVAALSAAIVFAASLSHLLASPALYGVTWDAAVTNNSGTGTGQVVATVKRDRQVAAWTTGWTRARLRAGRTEFEAIVLPMPGGMSFVLPPVTGRLPETSREIALGTKTRRQLHTPVGATIQVSLENAPARP